jgi:hypothetical protein
MDKVHAGLKTSGRNFRLLVKVFQQKFSRVGVKKHGNIPKN